MKSVLVNFLSSSGTTELSVKDGHCIAISEGWTLDTALLLSASLS